MTHHRCTRCKQESTRRHKYAQGLFCESCINELKRCRGYTRGFWGSIWDAITKVVERVFKRDTKKQSLKLMDTKQRMKLKVIKEKSLRIPVNPATVNPQKR